MDLQSWANENWFDNDGLSKYVYKEAATDQMQFVRDLLNRRLLQPDLHYDKVNNVEVISTHRSKSIILPVYELRRIDSNLRIILRNNFHNWKMSVISGVDIEADFSSLFYTSPPIEPDFTGDPLHSVYFEGFPSDLIFGYYEQNKKKFSAEIYSNYALYTSIFLILKSVGIIKPLEWATKK
jgi:hypothetical protein